MAAALTKICQASNVDLFPNLVNTAFMCAYAENACGIEDIRMCTREVGDVVRTCASGGTDCSAKVNVLKKACEKHGCKPIIQDLLRECEKGQGKACSNVAHIIDGHCKGSEACNRDVWELQWTCAGAPEFQEMRKCGSNMGCVLEQLDKCLNDANCMKRLDMVSDASNKLRYFPVPRDQNEYFAALAILGTNEEVYNAVNMATKAACSAVSKK
jgi:hypothetical protein